METIISGVYEVGIGARDAEPLLEYFERFGYRVGQTGELSAQHAKSLYNVDSTLKSIRLLHQDADHGLIRIMVWDQPINEGLQMSEMNVLGNRWGAMLTGDIYNLLNHAEEAVAQNQQIFVVPPQRAEIFKLETRPMPFLENYATVREMCLIRPLTRQILFQRFGYSLPSYGKIDEDSFFKSSQITHFGMVVYDEPENLDFYDQVLGLLRVRDGQNYDGNYDEPSSRAIFSLEKNQKYRAVDFDDPRSSADAQKSVSGRLKVILFARDSNLLDKFDDARPGSLGYSLYTLRVKGIENYLRKIKASRARDVTEIQLNEFGEKSFSFVAPDNYFWTIFE